jgi:alcohol dehydrogenase
VGKRGQLTLNRSSWEDKKVEKQAMREMGSKGPVYSMPGLQMPKSILFGDGSIEELGKAVKRLNGTRAIIITDRNLVKAGLLELPKEVLTREKIPFGLFEEVEFEPTIGVVEKGNGIIRRDGYDVVIGIGGGSVLDAAKVMSCLVQNEGGVRACIGKDKIERAGLPFILVPTTGGTGSEVSSLAMVTDDADGVKKLISDKKLFPDVALVDPLLTHSVPPKLTAYTGMDALCHAMGCYITRKANPLSDSLAIEAIYLISHSLRQAVLRGEDRAARYNLSLGASIGMIARINSGGGAVHGLSYPQTEKYHFPHGKAIALIMPYVMEYNVSSAIPKFTRMAVAMGEKIEGLSAKEAAEKAVDVIKKLMKDTGILEPLREFGIKREEFQVFADLVYEFSYRHIEANPRLLSKEEIIQIYENAW